MLSCHQATSTHHSFLCFRKSIPENVRPELINTMHLSFNITTEDASNLLDELVNCFHIGHEHISIYSYGSQADGVADVDVKILSALLKSHSESCLERFKLTMSWGRPDLADNEIFRQGKVAMKFSVLGLKF